MLLLYGVAEAVSDVGPHLVGLRGAQVLWVSEPVQPGTVARLRCYYSEFDAALPPGAAQRPQDDALAFHRVLQSLLWQAAVMPFRLPTLLPGVAAISEFLAANAGCYLQELERVRGKMQMEARIAPASPFPASEFQSGTKFLQARQASLNRMEDCVARVMEACSEAQWKRRTTADGACRLFALVERHESIAQRFHDAVLSVSLDPELQLRTSGPWPATEFVKLIAVSPEDAAPNAASGLQDAEAPEQSKKQRLI